MKKLSLLLAFCCLLTALIGCGKQTRFSESFYFMDTVIGVTLYTDDQDIAQAAFADCRALLSELDELWSRQKEGSEPTKFQAESTSLSNLDPRTSALLSTALEVSKKTEGAFDVTVAPLVELWEASEKADTLPSDALLSQALSHTGYETLSLEGHTLIKTRPEIQIDLGGIGKGAAISLLKAHLLSLDLDGGLITFGSNVAVFGNKPSGEPFRIALRDPHDAQASVGTILLPDGMVLSVSGDYERYVTINGQRYHHILDPATGYPAESGLTSVAVITSDGALADALSTAFFVMGTEKTLSFYQNEIFDFEAILIATDGTLTLTDGISDIFEKNS